MMKRQHTFRQPHYFLMHDRWLACIYDGGSMFFQQGWSLRHACGKYEKLNIEPLRDCQGRWTDHPMTTRTGLGWTVEKTALAGKIPVMFGNQMRRKIRRNPTGVCPRCKEKVPGGLAIWVTTQAIRGEKK